MTAEMVRRYKAQYEQGHRADRAIAPHVSMGFNNMWILLNDILPRAISKHGGFGPDALAKAARETDIPEGGTMQGYGVKFYPGRAIASPGRTSAPSPRSSRSSRASSRWSTPRRPRPRPPILPLPASSPLAIR